MHTRGRILKEKGAKVYLGLDSGGTKTQVAVLAADGTVLAQEISGPVRMPSRATPRVVRMVEMLIAHACRAAGADRGQIAAYGLGMAGVDYEEEIPTQRRTLFRALGIDPSRAFLVNDGLAALWGGSANRKAVILQLGTAYTAAYRDGYGTETPFDHYNAGVIYNMRHQILAHAARSWDGRAPRSILLPLLVDHFEVKRPSDISKRFTRGTIDNWKLLTVIDPWARAVEQGDRLSLRILEDGAKVYAGDVMHLLKRIGDNDADVALGGGQLRHGPARFRERIAELVRRKFPRVNIHGPSCTPAVGAALMAAWHDGASYPDLFRRAERTGGAGI